ncbi:MAG: hypothetical protein ACTTH6_02540 [Candidatus Altimarinota bacterium]
MKKNNKTISNIFVKKISEKGNSLMTKSELEKIWVRAGGSLSRFSFALNLLKNHNLLTRVAKDCYYLGDAENLDFLYWKIVDKIVGLYASSAIIAGEKALEWQMMNQMPPEKLVIFTQDFSARIRLFDNREIYFRTISAGERSGGKNLFSMLKKFTTKNENFKNLRFFSKEISLLEALSVHEKNAGTNEVLILQFLQRYHEKLDTEIFSQIAKYRYIRALNRLRVISKEQNFQKLYEKILEIIKKDGAGCFVSF